jgi:hypothetical protein
MMKTLTFLLVATIAIVLAGCSDNASSPVSPASQSKITGGAAGALTKEGAVVHAVLGSTNGNYGTEKNVVNTYGIRQYDDGSIDGEYLVNAANTMGHDKFYKWNGKAFFLKVYTDVEGFGTFAVVGGVEQTGPSPGWYDVFFVIDNGPGNQAQTGQVVFYTDDLAAALAVCNESPAALMAELGLVDADRGNLSIY